MDTPQFQRVMALFDEACQLSDDARRRLLDQECRSDADLRRRVEAMLAHDSDAADAGPKNMAAGAGQRLLAQDMARRESASRFSGAGFTSHRAAPILSGQYRILRMIGEGGMGVVYEAEQLRPRRIVALKAIRAGHTSRQLLKRFELEAHILGRLHHPGIAQIFDAGAADEDQPDQAFFAMEYVPGVPLTEFAAAQNLNIRQKLQLLIKVCDAVQHAHQRGIIHRDLKPSNILVGIEGNGVHAAGASQPKILDFGVARLTDGDPPFTTMHTVSGQLVGTLPYMSPEQMTGDPTQIDTRSDVYALGVIGYRMLAGRLPLDVGSCAIAEAARIVRDEEPPHLGSIDRQMRGDVETIMAKALEKDKSRRYQSASALAEDMQRFLNDQPIVARPPTVMYQLGKFARRHTAVSAASAAALLVLIAAVILVAIYGYKANRSAQDAKRQAYRATIAAASGALQAGDVSTARQRLAAVDEPDRNTWEWRHFDSQLIDSIGAIDAGTMAFAAVFLPNDHSLIVGSGNGAVTQWDVLAQPPAAKEFGRHTLVVRCLACTSDGSMVASGSKDKMIRLWDARSGTMIYELKGHTAEVNCITFSADGSYLVSGSDDRSVRLWDLRAGPENASPVTAATLRRSINSVAFNPMVLQFACAGSDGFVRVFNPGNAQEIRAIDHGTDVWALAYSADGKTLATAAEDKAIRLWDTATWRKLDTMRGHTSRINSIQFSPDGRLIASGSIDETVRLWNLATGTQAAVLKGHTQSVFAVTWSSDGETIASASSDLTVRLWDAEVADDVNVIRAHLGAVTHVAFNPDGKIIASTSSDGTLRLFDSATALPIVNLQHHGVTLHWVAFSPDGTRLVTASSDKSVKIWNTTNDEPLATLIGHEGIVLCAAFSPDGNSIASGSIDNTVRIWDVHDLSTRLEIATLTGHQGRVHCVTFSRDGSRLLSCSDDGTVRIWRNWKSSNAEFSVLQSNAMPVYCAVFSPDESRIVTSGADNFLHWWDASSGRELPVKLDNVSGGGQVAFSPDGTRLASGTGDGNVRLWDTASFQEVAILRGHTYGVMCVAFSPDGATLASASIDHTIRLHDTQPLAERLKLRRAAGSN